MPKYLIYAGLGGGFGKAELVDEEPLEFEDKEAAEEYAFDCACEHYESYLGMYGLRTIEEIMEQDEIDDEEIAGEVFNEERASWLDYYVEEVE